MDFQKTFSLTENLFSGKTYLYTIRPWSALQPATHAPPTHRTPFWQSPSAEHRCWQPPSEHCSPQPQSEEVLQLETQNPLEHLDPAGHDDWIPGEHLRLFFLQEW